MARDLGSLASLYRQVFWMIGKKAQYGRIWPPEADMGPDEPAPITPAMPAPSFEPTHATPVEAGARE